MPDPVLYKRKSVLSCDKVNILVINVKMAIVTPLLSSSPMMLLILG